MGYNIIISKNTPIFCPERWWYSYPYLLSKLTGEKSGALEHNRALVSYLGKTTHQIYRSPGIRDGSKDFAKVFFRKFAKHVSLGGIANYFYNG